MKTSKMLLLSGVALCCSAISSCTSSDSDELSFMEPGTGVVVFQLASTTEFPTASRAALNEEDYRNVANYDVQLIDNATGTTKETWKGNAIPTEKLKLKNGGYTLKAFYGDPTVAASTEKMYVYGERTFNVNSDEQEVSVTCTPTCARVKVEFDAAMDTYYSAYSVRFSTQALGAGSIAWSGSPIYLKVAQKESVKATISLTDKSGKSTSIERSYEMSPNEGKLIKFKPVLQGGQLGITITVDESTNDKPIDIIIPSEWIL